MLMAPVKLPCVISCGFETIPLEYDQAKEQVELHMRYCPLIRGGRETRNKEPESFPRQEEFGHENSTVADGLNRAGTDQTRNNQQERGELKCGDEVA